MHASYHGRNTAEGQQQQCVTHPSSDQKRVFAARHAFCSLDPLAWLTDMMQDTQDAVRLDDSDGCLLKQCAIST